MDIALNSLCKYRNEKIDVSKVGQLLYISTENMLSNKGGISGKASAPATGRVSLYRKNDILISNIRPYFKKIWKATTDGCCSNDVLVFEANSDCACDYLFWILSDDRFFDYMMASSKGTKMPRGDKNAIMNYPVSSRNEFMQKRIVAILNPIQEKIVVNNRINGYLEEMLDTMLKERFGGLSDNATLSDIADILMGQSPEGGSYNEDGIGTVFYQGRAEFGWRYPTKRLCTTKAKREACKGDILLSVRAPVGDINVAYEDCYIGRGLAALRCEYPSYCLYLVRSLRAKFEAYNGEGTVFGAISGKDLRSMPIALPSIKEIADFESLAMPFDKRIRANESESRSLTGLRDALLPKLMSGEIDISQVSCN